MHQKDTVGYWRIHCKEARRKVATLEIQNKAMREVLEELSNMDGLMQNLCMLNEPLQDKIYAILAKVKGESE